MSPFHQDFKSLLDEKLREETCESNVAAESRPIKTRTFLRKGEGLSRFRMKPEDFKLNKRVRPPKTHSAPVNTESNEKESILVSPYFICCDRKFQCKSRRNSLMF